MSIPTKDSLLTAYATNWDTRITATPATWQLLAADATAIHAVVTPYISAYNALVTARESGIRSSELAANKNAARDSLIAVLRQYYVRIQGNTSVTVGNKELLGITVRKVPTPIPVPAEQPNIDFVSVVGYVVTLDVHGSEEGKKGFPTGVAGVQIYTFVGSEPDPDPAAWFFQGGITKATKIPVEFPATTAPGAKVWFRACYFNPRNMCGPASDPVSTHLQFSSASMKIAA